MSEVIRKVRRHPWRSAAGLLLVLIGVGAFVGRDVIRLALTPDDPVDYTLPLAAPLQATAGETVYRIDAERSKATVHVEERLAGVDRGVDLTTQGITGDLGVTATDLSKARVGEVAVDVHQLESDNALRDKAIQHEYLDSHDHPVVTLTKATTSGLPATVPEGTTASFRITGDLVVKDAPHPVTFDAEARVQGDELTATATAKVKMSDLGVGPITKVGLVSTSNDMTVTLKLVAVDGRSFTPAAQLAKARTQDVRATGAASPSFKDRVGPLLAENCAACHRSGEAGADSWTFDTAGDAADVADGIAVVTGSRYMPPWPASDKSVPMLHPRALSAKDIDLLKDWAAAGGQLDEPRSTKIRPPRTPEVSVPRADLTLELSEPYQGSPAHPDDYRCFVLDPKFTTTTYMTGYVFTPDQTSIVHHALVYKQRASTRARIDAKDAADPGSGFACGAGMAGTGFGGQLVAGWVPGQRPQDFKPGDGFEFQPGDYLVAQIHYHYGAENPPDRSSMSMQVAPPGSVIHPLQTYELAAPVEMPCPAGSTGPLCDRNAALQFAAQRFGPSGKFIPDALHLLCGTTPQELASLSDGHQAHTTCDYRVQQSGKIIDVLGHMHVLGSSYRMTLNPGTPQQKILLDIPTWNFNWQLNYAPVDEIPVKPGDVIRAECNWNRDLVYEPNPRYIVFAEGTGDEMCFSTYTLRPDVPPRVAPAAPAPPAPAPPALPTGPR